MIKLMHMVKEFALVAIARRPIQNWEHDERTLKFWRGRSNFANVLERNQEINILSAVQLYKGKIY